MSLNFARRVAGIPLVLVFIASLTLSWAGLTALGVRAGFGGISWLLPLVIDGTVMAGALSIVVATEHQTSTRFGWSVMIGGAAVSTYGNVAGADGSGWTAGFTHAIAPLALALTLEAWLRTVRRDIEREQAEQARIAAEAEAAQRREEAAQKRRERAEKRSGSTTASKASTGRQRAAQGLSEAEREELREVASMLGENASVTAQARAVLAVRDVSGGVLAEVLGLTPRQGYKAKERATRLVAAS